jgi:hypothetical protein
MRVVVSDRTVLGSGDVLTTSKTVESTSLLKTDFEWSEPAYVELPFGGVGIFAGMGNSLHVPGGIQITFDSEGVLYEPD